ncbi:MULTISPECIES: orotate phosphoribosyltransferase [unclassified Rothia (in: high G+C Gram-positive bacteria)]|uniref:orotate phosphoribosyltransferase n=1 Tax=unclassified Rothia (in: high G+C Gram-positive bacteria) TaxID=2689056 RepID=UPI00195747A5|nr:MULTISPECIES: orotate phosphoribosyltransferase [unclassified Rothia (in: high G+C Gram-positive bacteria)]MBM7051650.1 orotate phosphoribosyltransferase [Rothia sp. ZJ1223]QRZ61710.1 orotate phosphoribosyltransferase [Rothia sp. ZJ932]
MANFSNTLPIDQARERLRELISELAVVRGKVTLASGKEADYYVDLRRITLHHEASRLVGQVMLDLLDQNAIEFEAAGGLTMGADPVGHAIMRAAGDAGRAIDTFVVRKAQKSYGMGRQVEGPSVEGRRVVAVEDTSTTGGSALTAVEALKKAGAEVVAVAVIVDRATGAKEHIEEIAGVPCFYAYSKDDLGLS